MLGKLLYEETGQVTGVRVLSSDGGEVVTEVSLQAEGKIQGTADTSLWTYQTTQRADGSMIGSGEGVMTTKTGDIINLIGSGTAKKTAPGKTLRYTGAIYFYSASRKWSKLNGVTGVHEYTLAPDGNCTIKVYEWK